MLISMFVLHFIADFLLQSREMGTKKSSEVYWLAKHLAIQWTVFAVCLLPWLHEKAIYFATLNALIHGLIDWNVWKLYKFSAYVRIMKIVTKKHGTWTQPPEEDVNIKAEIVAWKYWEDHVFYSTIGFDQMLHAITIIYLYGVLV